MALTLSSVNSSLHQSPLKFSSHLPPLNKNRVQQSTPLHNPILPTCTPVTTENQESSPRNNFLDTIKPLFSFKETKHIKFLHKNGGILTLKDLNSLLISLVEENKLDIAEKLFQISLLHGVKLNSRSFSIMVECYCNKKELHEAKNLLYKMIDSGFTPNVVTFTTVINSFCSGGRVMKGFEVFEVMRKNGCEPTILTYNCLMKGLCYVGKVEEASRMLKKIKESSTLKPLKPLKPDIYSYTAVMDGFCKVGRADEGMELLEDAIADGLNPTVVTFNTLFDGYCREGRPLEGVKLLKRMKERDCQPDYITYSSLLHGLVKWDKVLAGLKVYKEAVESGFVVEERIMNTLLRRVCRRSWTKEDLFEDVMLLFERIKKVGFIVYPETYCLVIQTLSTKGEIDKAVASLEEMIRHGSSPTLITFNVVIRVLCGEGRVDEAIRILLLITEVGKIPSIFPYSLMISELNKQERFIDACKIYAAAVKHGVHSHKPSRRNVLEA